MLLAHLRRIESQLIGDLVHLDFLGPTRLRSAVTPLRTARRLIGEDSNGLKPVVRQFVGRRLKDARVERARYTVAAVGAAVQNGAVVHGSDRTIFFVTRLRRHQHRMPAAMAVKDLLTRQTDFHRPPGDHR